MSTDNQSAQSRKAFEDAVFNAYFFKSIKRNPNPPRGTGAMDFIATATKTQAELCERDGESYKDEAVSAMWFGWGLATRSALAQAPAPSGEALALLRELVDSHFFGDGMEWSWRDGVTLMEKDRSLFDRIRTALASPGAMEGAQAPPVAFAYYYEDGRPFTTAFANDVARIDDNLMLDRPVVKTPLYAHPPTGEPT